MMRCKVLEATTGSVGDAHVMGDVMLVFDDERTTRDARSPHGRATSASGSRSTLRESGRRADALSTLLGCRG